MRKHLLDSAAFPASEDNKPALATDPRSPGANPPWISGISGLGLERVVSERDAASFLGVAHVTLKRLRLARNGPRHVRLGERRIGYAVKDLIAWRDSRTA
jgi:predicted DNA-binding transcriptional regulator AlpA